MAKKITYTEAYNELLEIVAEIENSEIGIDLLDDKIKRAAQLLRVCKDKLYKTEESVTQVLEGIRETEK